jgi:hypothetical protein
MHAVFAATHFYRTAASALHPQSSQGPPSAAHSTMPDMERSRDIPSRCRETSHGWLVRRRPGARCERSPSVPQEESGRLREFSPISPRAPGPNRTKGTKYSQRVRAGRSHLQPRGVTRFDSQPWRRGEHCKNHSAAGQVLCGCSFTRPPDRVPSSTVRRPRVERRSS